MSGEAPFSPAFIRWSEAQFWADPRVAALQPLERHLYRALLLAAFRCETRPLLPLDEIKLAALADAPSIDSWKQCSRRVLAMFDRHESGYGSDYVTAEYARALTEERQALATPRKRHRTPGRLPRGAPEGFEEFWKLYPKRVGKKVALESWARLKPDPGLCERIMEALRSQLQLDQWRQQQGKFIPHPASWLNQARWEDETPIPRKTHLPSLF